MAIAKENVDLIEYFSSGAEPSIEDTKDIGHQVVKILESLKLPSQLIDVQAGPTVTTVSVKPSTVSRIDTYLRASVETNIAFHLGVEAVRIHRKNDAIQIEASNPNRGKVVLNMVYRHQQALKPLLFPLGLGQNNIPQWASLATMPHLLVAGATGSGKSVLLQNILVAFHTLYTPDDVRLIIIDPKRVDFAAYENSPFLAEHGKIYDKGEGIKALEKLDYIMRERYELMKSERVRNISKLNERGGKYPYIVCVVDEIADFFNDRVHGEDAKKNVMNIAQLGRAAGIHLVIATQRPSAKIIDGDIKANFPARAGLRVLSHRDSGVIIDASGCEKLQSVGEAIYIMPGHEMQRVAVPFVSEEDVEMAVNLWWTSDTKYTDLDEYRNSKDSSELLQWKRETDPEEKKRTEENALLRLLSFPQRFGTFD